MDAGSCHQQTTFAGVGIHRVANFNTGMPAIESLRLATLAYLCMCGTICLPFTRRLSDRAFFHLRLKLPE